MLKRRKPLPVDRPPKKGVCGSLSITRRIAPHAEGGSQDGNAMGKLLIHAVSCINCVIAGGMASSSFRCFATWRERAVAAHC